jgi:hypothetical protein
MLAIALASIVSWCLVGTFDCMCGRLRQLRVKVLLR